MLQPRCLLCLCAKDVNVCVVWEQFVHSGEALHIWAENMDLQKQLEIFVFFFFIGIVQLE